MQDQVGSKRGCNGNDGDEMLILVDNKRSDRQPMPLLKRAHVATETVRRPIVVGMVCEGRARNAVVAGF